MSATTADVSKDLDRAIAQVPAPLRVWLAPVRPCLEIVMATKDKPLGQMNMAEISAWIVTLGYLVTSGYVAGRIGANLAAVALKGPYRR